jgi:hypothetical protein
MEASDKFQKLQTAVYESVIAVAIFHKRDLMQENNAISLRAMAPQHPDR